MKTLLLLCCWWWCWYFFISQICCLASSSKKVPSFYADSNTINSRIVRLAELHEDRVTLYTRHINSKPVHGFRIHAKNDHGSSSSSRKSSVNCRKQLTVMMVCGMHARELISSDICMNIIERLLSRSDSNSYWLDLMFVPLLDPSGRDVVFRKDNCRRTNSAGVDLNRNWPWFFGPPKRDIAEEDPGKHPWDQPETQFLGWLMTPAFGFLHPDVLVSVHSGAEMILYPFDGTEADVHLKSLHHHIADAVREAACPYCSIGPGSVLLYRSSGTLMDAMVFNHNFSMAFTWEVFESLEHRLAGGDCLGMFNPLVKEEHEQVLLLWTRGYYKLLNILEKIINSKNDVFYYRSSTITINTHESCKKK